VAITESWHREDMTDESKVSATSRFTSSSGRVEPFLRWAGGKRWLARMMGGLLPSSFKTYFEPFLGSGAIFFSLQPGGARLSDSNQNLIKAYELVRDSPGALITRLEGFSYTPKEYYRVRSSTPGAIVDQSARFLYLNRTCWNGLYRVDRTGEFNVPYGRRGAFHERDASRIRAASEVLRTSTLRCEDFEVALSRVRPGDFAFVDPPYTVTHGENGFLLYNERIFSWADQERLASALEAVDRRGGFFLLTNANHRSVRALYKSFANYSLRRNSILAANPKNRRVVTELLVANYRMSLKDRGIRLAS